MAQRLSPLPREQNNEVFMKITFMTKCPYCKNTSRYRIHRDQWMHILPISRHYECNNCHAEYLSVLHSFSFGLLKGYTRFYLNPASEVHSIVDTAASMK